MGMKSRLLTRWVPTMATGRLVSVIAWLPQQSKVDVIASSLTVGAAAAYTVLTYFLAGLATDQAATLAGQLSVQTEALEGQRRFLADTSKQFNAQLELANDTALAASRAVVEASRTRVDDPRPF